MQSLFSNTPMRLLGGLTVFMVFVALASYASLNFEKIKHVDTTQATISVTGEGEVIAVPDIGQFTFSVQAKADTAEVAQEQSGTAINDIIAFLEQSGVDDTDIKTTSYNLYPQYQWVRNRICPAEAEFCPEGERVQTGFEVSQSVQVKVRDTDAATSIISGVGERGATNISGLDFVVDDTDALQDQARTAAIADAKAKASALAKDLGVRIVRLTGYYEDDAQNHEADVYFARSMAADEATADFGGAELPMGEETTTAQVTVIYEVR